MNNLCKFVLTLFLTLPVLIFGQIYVRETSTGVKSGTDWNNAISYDDLVNKINSLGKEAKYIPDFDECVSYIKNNIEQNDIVMTLGAGTVTKIGPMLIS